MSPGNVGDRQSLIRCWARRAWVGVLSLLLMVSGLVARAAQDTFTVGGVPFTLTAVNAGGEVYLQAMRLNRALGAWNVDVWITNATARDLQGPLVLRVDNASGTGGPVGADGVSGSGLAYYDLGAMVDHGALAPGQRSRSLTLTLATGTGTPRLALQLFENQTAPPPPAALVRSLNEVGQPLPGVTVSDVSGGEIVTTDPVFGIATLTGPAGDHAWRFDAQGYWPAWRRHPLAPGEVAVIPSPRLVPRATGGVGLTPIAGGHVATADGSVQLDFAPGSFAQDATARMTPMSGQTLPGLLPPGWSPMQAFWIDLSVDPLQPAGCKLVPWGSVGVGETAALVRWNESTLRWEVLQVGAGNGTNAIAVSVPSSGAFALVLGDPNPIAPPAPVQGQPLQPSAAPVPATQDLAVTGRVTPSASAASPVAEWVTGTAMLSISNRNGNLASGLLLRGEVRESYVLVNGVRRSPPQYEHFMVGYQRPGDPLLSTLGASFPVRPLWLLGGDQLDQAVVDVDILAPIRFSGGMLDGAGGQVAFQGARVLAGPGDLRGWTAVQFRAGDPTNITEVLGTGLAVVRSCDLLVSGVSPDRRLVIQWEGLPTNRLFVLAQRVSGAGHYGLEPRERLRSDAQGRLVSLEPADAPRLGGIQGPGQYALIELSAPQGLLTGTARNAAGQVRPGLPVAIPGSPWLTFSSANGIYRLIAPVGETQLAVSDPATGDAGLQTATVQGPGAPTAMDVAPSASGPVATLVTPGDGAANVDRVSPVVVRFSHPIRPASLGPDAVQLLDASQARVSASLSLNLRGTEATLLPLSPLAGSTLHTVVISPGVVDLNARPLAGPSRFTFSTASALLNRSGAQLVSYEPAGGLAPLYGTPGTADAESPVILVNETSGQTSTILSRPDGSFTNVIEAGVDDILSAVLVNRNGTRTTIPVSRQVFRDGSVGLFRGGGILEAQSDGGPVQVLVEPDAIPGKTKFKIDLVGMMDLLALVKNTPPEGGQLISGLKIKMEGDSLATPPDISIPLNVASLNLPEGQHPEDRQFALCEPIEVDGVTVYSQVDTMQYEDGKLVTHSPPFPGAGMGGLFTATLLPIGMDSRLTVVGQVVTAVASLASGGLKDDEYASGIVDGKVRPVPGAVVSADPMGAIPESRPGLHPGTFVVRANSAGMFAMRVPFNAYQGGGLILSARSPLMPMLYGYKSIATPTIFDSAFPLAGGRIVFTIPDMPNDALDKLPPRVSLQADARVLPVGTNVDLLCTLRDDLSAPLLASATVDFGRSMRLPNGEPLTTTDVASLTTGTQGQVSATVITQAVSLQLTNAARVVLNIEAKDSASPPNSTVVPFVFYFGAPPTPAIVPTSNPNDTNGPMVTAVSPADGVMVSDFSHLVVSFSEPVSATVTNRNGGGGYDAMRISSSGPGVPNPYLELSPDQLQLSIYPGVLEPGCEYTVTLNNNVVDLSGNALDQDPSTSSSDSFSTRFRTAPAQITSLAGVQRSAGSVIVGDFAITIDRTDGQHNGVLAVHRLDPSTTTPVVTTNLPPYPRAITLIPSYDYKLHPDTTPASTNRTLVVVVGGLQGGASDDLGNMTGLGQWLCTFDVTDPTQPRRIAYEIISLDLASAATMVRWDAPNLGVLTLAPEGGLIHLINLQAFILGANYRTQDLAQVFGPTLRGPYERGTDSNRDGDYVDAGEVLPVANTSGIFGSEGIIQALGSRTITDFDLALGGAYLVGVMPIRPHSPGTPMMPPRLQNLVYAGEVIGLGNTNVGMVEFDAAARVSRVLLDLSFPVVDAGGSRSIPAAIVAVDGALRIFDLTDPQRLAAVSTNQLSREPLDVYSLQRTGPDEYAVGTSKGLFFLRRSLMYVAAGAGEVHPAVDTRLGLLTTARTFGLSRAHVVAPNGGSLQFMYRPPSFHAVRAPLLSVTNIGTITQITDVDTILTLTDPGKRQFELSLEEPMVAGPCFLTNSGACPGGFDPPSALQHHYVLVDAWGGLGRTIRVSLESVDAHGKLLPPRSKLFPPVILTDQAATLNLTEAQPAVSAIVAKRMSDDPGSPLYHKFLGGPLILVREPMDAAQLARMASIPGRVAVWSGHALRMSLDAGTSSSMPNYSDWVSRINGGEYQAVLSGSVITVPGEYLDTPNPSMAGAAPRVAGVDLQAGEFRQSNNDAFVEGRHQDLVFSRVYESRSRYFGPLGVGWDFNWNARIFELNSSLLPVGFSLCPSHFYNDAALDRMIMPGDAVFIDGVGGVHHFRQISDANRNLTNRVAYSSDPALVEFGWTSQVATFFESPPGEFSVLYKFRDGAFVLLAPNGVQTYFRADGRLDRVVGTYPDSTLVCEYRRDGKLNRVKGDRGVDLEFGYYGRTTSPDFAALDKPYNKVVHIGLLARIKAAGADVKYEYSDAGVLEKFTDAVGRVTRYGVDPVQPFLLKSVGRDDGTKFPAQTVEYDQGLVKKLRQLAQDMTFAGSLAKASDRYAEAVGTLSITVPGGQPASLTVDNRGRPAEFANRDIAADDNGRLTDVANAHTSARFRYDTNNAVHRFRGNLLGTEQVGKPSFKTGFRYDGTAYNRLVARTNTEGVITTYAYQMSGRYVATIDEITGPVTRSSHMNNFGQLTEELVSEGSPSFRKAIVYEASSGLPQGKILGSGATAMPTFTASQAGGGAGAANLTYSATPDGQPSRIASSGLPGVVLGYTDGLLTSESVTAAAGSMEIGYTYDAAEKSKVKTVLHRETGLPASSTTYTYDRGRVKTIETDGEVTTMTYDGTLMTGLESPGRKRTVTYASGKANAVTEQGVTASFAYDAEDRVQTVTQQGAVTTFAYNLGSQIRSKKISEGALTLLDENYTYDSAGRRVSVTSGGAVREFDYFGDGAVRKVKIGGTVIKEITRDNAGRVTGIELPGLVKYEYSDPDAVSGQYLTESVTLMGANHVRKTRTYDATGRLKKVEWPAGSWTYTYDEFGNPTGKSDPDGVGVKHVYAPGGLLLETTFIDGSTVTHSYGPGRHLQSIGAMTYLLDSDKLIERVNYPDGTYSEFRSRNVYFEPTQVRHGGINQTHTWTEGRLTRIQAGGDTQDYTYDGLGRKRTASLNGYQVTFGYDARGQYSSETTSGAGVHGAPRVWAATFNTLNQLTTESYPSGLTLDWSPASGSGLPSKAAAAGIESVTWHGPGLLSEVAYSSGVKAVRQYDASLRRTGIVYQVTGGGSTQTVAGFQYALTPGGRVKWEQRLHEGAYDVYERNSATEGMRITGFKFSASDSSGSAAVSSVTGFGFNANAELTAPTASVAGDMRAFHPPFTLDALGRVDVADGVSVGYDAQGSVSTTPVWVRLPTHTDLTRETAVLTYDGFGMVRELTRGSGADTVTVHYIRDGLGRVIQRTVSGPSARCRPGVTQYAWKGRQLLEEYEQAAGVFGLVRRYVYAGEDLVEVQSAGTPGGALETYYPLVNLNGSVCGYLNGGGFLTEIIWYGAYGTPVFLQVRNGVSQGAVDRSAIGNTVLFQGAWFEEEFGLYQMGQRNLHPQLGRFLQRDNRLYAESKAMFTAFNGDPVGRIDPAGAMSVSLDQLKELKENASEAQGKANDFLKALADTRNDDKRDATKLTSSGLDLAASGLKIVNTFGSEEFKEFAAATTETIDSLKSGLELVQLGLDMRRDRLILTAVKAHALAPAGFSSQMKWLHAGGAAADFKMLDGHFWNSEEIVNARKFQAGSSWARSQHLHEKHSYQDKTRGNLFTLAEKGSTFALDLFSKAAQGSDSLAPPNETLVDFSKGLLALKDKLKEFQENKELAAMQFFTSEVGWKASIKGLWANKSYLQASFEFGYKLGQRAVVVVCDPIVGEVYTEAMREWDDNGGVLCAVAGVLSWANRDSWANALRNYSQGSPSFMEQYVLPTIQAVSGTDSKTQLYLRGLDAP